MTSRKVRFILAVVVFFLMVLMGCNKAEQPRPAPKPGQPTHQPGLLATAWQVTLVYNGGACLQYVSGTPGATPFPVINGDDTVTWTASSFVGGPATPFDVQFSASPFPTDFNSPNAAAMTSAPVNGIHGVHYTYATITINGNPCNNPYQLGFVMR